MRYDYHVHIGQYNNVYFYPDRVFSALKYSGVEECNFSSTSSCIYCKSCETIQNNNELIFQAPSALELYDAVKSEIEQSIEISKDIGIKANPYYWVVPDIIRSGISIEKAFTEIKYSGFKIHTRAQNWNLDRCDIYEIADAIFDYACINNKKIMIHTGVDDMDSPLKFEKLIKKYRTVEVQLAHCKNYEAMSYMLENYENVYTDTSCTSKENIEMLEHNFSPDRIKYGSDFPCIYWNDYLKQDIEEPSIEKLKKLYKIRFNLG